MTATLEAEPPPDHEPGSGTDGDTARAAATRPRGKGGKAGAMLYGAMLGLADALGWDKPREETVEMADAPSGEDDDLDLDFGALDPLDWQ